MRDGRPDLRSLISAIRTELEQADAAARAARKDTLFRLAGLELELNFIVKTTDTVKGGFDLKIVSLGSQIGASSEEVQKVRVRFDVAKGAFEQGVLGTRYSDEAGEGPRAQSVVPLK